MPALLTQGKTAIRDAIKNVITHVGIGTDSTAFAVSQTTLSPGGGTNLIKSATKVNVTVNTTDDGFDASITIDGTTEFTGLTIRTIGILTGSGATTATSRTVRAAGIGVQAGDSFTIGVRVVVEDNSA